MHESDTNMLVAKNVRKQQRTSHLLASLGRDSGAVFHDIRAIAHPIALRAWECL
jgi:hypothetical protein